MEWISDNDDDNGVDFIELKEKLAEYNLYLIDKTGPIRNFRHLEIEEYLAEHSEIQNYIIIDDRTDAGIRDHFIKTNGHNGLSAKNVEKAINGLNRVVEENKCPYCSEDKDTNGWDDIYQDSLTGDWYIHHRTCEWDKYDDDYVYDKIYINYCPWCGKKLINKISDRES